MYIYIHTYRVLNKKKTLKKKLVKAFDHVFINYISTIKDCYS